MTKTLCSTNKFLTMSVAQVLSPAALLAGLPVAPPPTGETWILPSCPDNAEDWAVIGP